MDPSRFIQLRHRWEMPMIWASVALTFIAVAIGLWILATPEVDLKALFGKDLAEVEELGSYALLLPLAPVAIYLMRLYMAADIRSKSLRVGSDQFPSLWQRYRALGEKLEMPQLPAFYVVNGNGVVNAFALSCNSRRKYVVIHAEIALLTDSAPDIVDFVLAHELAHHKLNHVSLWRIVIGMVPKATILPGAATSRAQEYSADRVAASVCPGCAPAARVLAVGPWMQKEVNPEAWAQQAEAEHGSLFIRFVNGMSSHAVLTKRYKALRDLETKDYDRHGEMF